MDFFNDFLKLISGMMLILHIVAVVIMAFGVLLCFWGFKVNRILITINGFCFFGIIGMLLGVLFDIANFSLLLGIVCGIVGAFLSYKLIKVGIFISCAMSSFYIGSSIGMLMLVNFKAGQFGNNAIIAGVLFAIIGGVLSLIFTKAIIVVNTSFNGGIMIGLGLGLVGFGIPGFSIGAICIIAGMIVQFIKNKHIPMSAASPKLSRNNQPYSYSNMPNGQPLPVMQSNVEHDSASSKVEQNTTNI